MDSANVRFSRVRNTGAAIVSTLVAVLTGACTQPENPSRDFVASEWAGNVRTLHIDPVYPPREDFQAGDLFLAKVRIAGDAPGVGDRVSLHVGYIDLTAEIKAHYARRIRFPKTAEKPDQGKVWQQSASAADVFSPSAHDSLPIVRFPGFTLARINRVQGGASLPFKFFSAVFGGAKVDEETVTLSVPAAESYGLPAAAAYRKYVDICYKSADATKPPQCDPRVLWFLRNSLPGGYDPKIDTMTLVLVTEVFYAREIDYSFGAGSGFGFNADLVLRLQSLVEAHKLASSIRTDGAPPKQSSGEGAATGGTKTTPGTAPPEYTRLLEQIDSALKGGGDFPGASLSVLSLSTRGITLRQTFPRPVAIGYRSIRFGVPKPQADRDGAGRATLFSETARRVSVAMMLASDPGKTPSEGKFDPGEPPDPPPGGGVILNKPDVFDKSMEPPGMPSDTGRKILNKKDSDKPEPVPHRLLEFEKKWHKSDAAGDRGDRWT